jgi:hypothetical protein
MFIPQPQPDAANALNIRSHRCRGWCARHRASTR